MKNKKMPLRLLLFGALAALAAALVALDLPSWKRLDLQKITSAAASTLLYDANGEEMPGLYPGAQRVYARLEEMPPYLPDAFVAAEDARFFEHSGVDVRRIFGAALNNLRTMSLSQGASTITQQLVRLTHLSAEKTFGRKAQEALLALQLERRMSKEEILEYYINIAYFGSGAYGAASAAQVYFSKDVAELTLAEAALLAGLVKAPSSYEPDEHPEKALARRSYVLSCMLENGYITQTEHDDAQSEPLQLRMSAPQGAPHGWYVDAVLEEACAVLDIGAEAFLSGGYRVYTALDPTLSGSAAALFSDRSRFPPSAEDSTPAQAALAAVEPASGEVLALIGGREYTTRRGLNRAASILRQPGSAFKPVSVYAAAIDKEGYVPSSLITDEQRDFGGGYSPSNAGGKFYGAVTLRTALSKSLNAASVDLITRTGVSSAREYAQRLGLPLSKADNGPSLALGALTDGVSPLQLCSAYAAIANGGSLIPAHCIRRIEDGSGEVLYSFSAEPTQAMRPESASLLTSMLESAVTDGSAKALQAAGFPVAAKTGTVAMEDEGNRDAWIAAYTPNLSLCIWMGFDEPDAKHCLPEGSGGSSYPARLATALLTEAKGKADAGAFPLAPGLEQVSIDRRALEEFGLVMRSGEYTPPSLQMQELFFTGSAPTQVSNIWQAPSMVWDLTVAQQDGLPVIEFTAEAEAGYRVLRETDGEQTCVAEVVSSAAGPVRVVDGSAQPDKTHFYSVVPFHALLAKEQIELCGAECLPVEFRAKSKLWELFLPDATSAPAVQEEQPLFTEAS
ncbi:MAG: PBP1A family penicillin-binding protein [Eubacteriales bacterium]|nr:PBP1A family penicillin-binding protein [Eubacteriales bacterium]